MFLCVFSAEMGLENYFPFTLVFHRMDKQVVLTVTCQKEAAEQNKSRQCKNVKRQIGKEFYNVLTFSCGECVAQDKHRPQGMHRPQGGPQGSPARGPALSVRRHRGGPVRDGDPAAGHFGGHEASKHLFRVNLLERDDLELIETFDGITWQKLSDQ